MTSTGALMGSGGQVNRDASEGNSGAPAGSGGDGGPNAHCRNGVVEAGEPCDDGNARSHDGCSSGCTREEPNWTHVPTAHAPSLPGTMLYHAPRDTAPEHALLTVLSGETWRFDGNDWSVVASAPAWDETVAVSADLGISILFGGQYREYRLGNDTWSFGGDAWGGPLGGAGDTPRARAGHAMASRGWDRPALLFGGCDPDWAPLNDTWEFSYESYSSQRTSGWQELSPPEAPPARGGHAMAYDARAGEVVLFGGWTHQDHQVVYLGDTWLFANGVWRRGPDGPPARVAHAMAYDRLMQRVVLFGGVDIDGGRRTDTWEWTGEQWLEVHPAVSPAAPDGAWLGSARDAMAYDIASARTVLLDSVGRLDEVRAATWTYRWSSDWPEEDCSNGTDDDADDLADCTDPDCDERPCGR